MALRASSDDLKDACEQRNDSSGNPIPFDWAIRKASLLVDRTVTCATGRNVTLSADEQKEIEILVACHFYTLRVPQMKSKGTQSASGSWEVKNYLESAYMLDPSGCLRSIIEGKRAGVFWGGKRKSDQVAYSDRD